MILYLILCHIVLTLRVDDMPRIRTIKPEFCVSEQVAECSTTARLLFVLMWCWCDDGGRHPANTKRLKMELFPGDSFSDKEMRGFVSELIEAGLLIEYVYENAVFWQVTGWKKHQKIDKPNFKYGPFDGRGYPADVTDSTTIRLKFDEESPNDRRPLTPGREGKGKEGNGKEGILCDVGENSPTSPPSVDFIKDFSFLLCNGDEWFLEVSKLDEYKKTFPHLDLILELRTASQWTRDNPSRRKTKNGMYSFLGRWLSKAQNGTSNNKLSLTDTAGKRDSESKKLFDSIFNAKEGAK